MNKRLFTFGCSHTQYCWPTWADILLSVYGGQNWGKSGAGNKFIVSSLNECIVTNQLSKDDVVIIMWTSWAREDRYLNGQWLCGGNVYNHYFYDKVFLQKYWDDTGAVLDTFNNMVSAFNILDNIGCEYLITSAYPLYQVKEWPELSTVDDIVDINKFQKYLDFISKYQDKIVHENLFHDKRVDSYVFSSTSWSLNKDTTDPHASTEEHYNWLKQYVIPRLNLTATEKRNIESNANYFHSLCINLFDSNNRMHPTVKNYSDLKSLLKYYPERI